MAKKIKFNRTDVTRYSKLGKGRKKLQRWRKPTGRDNKIREKRRGYGKMPSVGFKSNKDEKGKIRGKMPMVVYNILDLRSVGKENIVVVGRVGAKKKIEIVKKALEKKLQILNFGGKQKQ
jgi:large subunit ribosomal protein L32e